MMKTSLRHLHTQAGGRKCFLNGPSTLTPTGKLRVSSRPKHVYFGLWEETGEGRENPCGGCGKFHAESIWLGYDAETFML